MTALPLRDRHVASRRTQEFPMSDHPDKQDEDQTNKPDPDPKPIGDPEPEHEGEKAV